MEKVNEEESKATRKLLGMNQLLRPLLVVMSLFGHYSLRLSRSNYFNLFLTGYRLLVIAFLFCTTGDVIVKFNEIGRAISPDPRVQLSFSALSALFYLGNTATAFCLLIACSRKEGFPVLLEYWRFPHGRDIEIIKSYHNRLQKCTIVCLFVVFLFIAIALAFSILGMTNKENPLPTYYLAYHLISTIYHLATWSVSTVFILIISLALWAEFNNFQREFKEKITSKGKFSGELEEFRSQHQTICRLVEKVDDLFSPVIGFGLLLNSAQILLALYLSVLNSKNEDNIVYTFGTVYWMVCAFTVVAVFCLSGGLVNHAAHSVLSDVYDMNIPANRDISVEVFLSRLTNENIGLTAMKMFVINKPMIMTICGLLVTYYLVLLQFNSATDHPHLQYVNVTTTDTV